MVWGALGRVREAHALKFGCVRLRFAKDFLPGFFLVIFWSADRVFGLGRFGESWGELGKRKKVPGGLPVKIARVSIRFARKNFVAQN